MSDKEKSLDDLLTIREYFAVAAQELQGASQRIKRLQEAGDEMAQELVNKLGGSDSAYRWCKAKETNL